MIKKNGNFNNLINHLNEYKKILILTGKNSFYKSGASKIRNLIKKKKIKVVFKKSYIPTSTELKSLFSKIKLFSPDVVLAIGGGCVLDYSKILNNIDKIRNIENRILDNKFIFKKRNFYLVCVPTTAGSGAEVTPSAVLYINKKKTSLENKLIAPNKFFLIPELVIKSPKKLKSSSGFDAISQAIESIFSIKSTPLSIKYASNSLKISLENYLNFINSPNYLNSSKMLNASNLAGKAISIAKTIAPHAVSYPFTSYFNISHGHAVSLTLNDFLKFNYKNLNYAKPKIDLKKRYKILFNIFKVKNIYELDQSLNKLKKLAGLENDFKKLGINLNKDINIILNNINDQRLLNNPVELKVSDIKQILILK